MAAFARPGLIRGICPLHPRPTCAIIVVLPYFVLAARRCGLYARSVGSKTAFRDMNREQKVLPMSATWRKRAACRGIDVEIFYPATEDEADAAEAKAVCAECPVRQACLEHALANREREGVWGGATERERRRIIRQRRKSA